MNNHLLNITESGTVALADKVRNKIVSGIEIIPLHTGDPDFSTPIEIIEAGYKALKDGFTHYGNSRGIDELRSSIAKKLIVTKSINYNPINEIIVTHGGIHAYFLALYGIINLGDEVLIQDPTWMSHFNIIKLLGGVPVKIETNADFNFLYQEEQIVSKITSKTKAIVINSPSNPTGTIYSKEHIEMIINIALKHKLFIISDEVYDRIILDDNIQFTSFSQYEIIKDQLLLCNSFSKTYAMTGWRIGYLCGPQKILSNCLKASQCTITNVSPFIQKAALEALNNQFVEIKVQEMVETYRDRLNKVFELKKLISSKIELLRPQGAFYIFADVSKLNLGTSQQVAELLLEELNVATVPGSIFGQAGEGYIRLTIASSTENVINGFRKFFSLG